MITSGYHACNFCSAWDNFCFCCYCLKKKIKSLSVLTAIHTAVMLVRGKELIKQSSICIDLPQPFKSVWGERSHLTKVYSQLFWRRDSNDLWNTLSLSLSLSSSVTHTETILPPLHCLWTKSTLLDSNGWKWCIEDHPQNKSILYNYRQIMRQD